MLSTVTEADIHPIQGVDTSITAFIGPALQGPVNQPTHVHSELEFRHTFGGLWVESPMSYAVSHFFQNGGRHAIVVRLAKDKDGDGGALDDSDYLGSSLSRTGLYALKNASVFNLLCIPPKTRSEDIGAPVWGAALDFCKEHRALLIVDPPSEWNDVAAVKAGLDPLGLRVPNAVLYFPRVKMADPLQGYRLETLAPCGIIAGIIASTDENLGVWTAPTGALAALRGVQKLTCELSDSDCGQLESLGVNYLQNLPGTGVVAGAALTLARFDPERKYLHVRRLTLYLKESIDRGTRWAHTESNNERLWAGLRKSVDGFMKNLWRRGAFQGETAEQAYFVKCDQSTTTADNIDSGIVNIHVGFAPLHPDEFLVIRIQQRAVIRKKLARHPTPVR